MNAKSEKPLPPDEFDPDSITSDPDLLFDAEKALSDQIQDEISSDAVETSDKEGRGAETLEQDPALELLSTVPATGVQDDPVRLYLKDIGSIELLDVNHEFWLAARMAAIRRLDVIGRQHPMASLAGSPQTRIFRALFEEATSTAQNGDCNRPSIRAPGRHASAPRHRIGESHSAHPYSGRGVFPQTHVFRIGGPFAHRRRGNRGA